MSGEGRVIILISDTLCNSFALYFFFFFYNFLAPSYNHFLLFFWVFCYAPPQKVAGYYVIPSELLSVCPSVCPSAVEHSCPVHNFDTV